MGKRLSAVVSAIFLMPFAYPQSALSWNWTGPELSGGCLDLWHG